MSNLEILANLIFPDINETIEDLEKKYPVRNLSEGAMVTRFAPSPTGFLHTGSLFTSMISHKFAKQTNGVFFVRLEDTDQKREVKDSGKELIEQMAVFGIVPDEGYLGDNDLGNYGPYEQSKRAHIYNVVIKDMIKRGLAYPCFCTPEELEEIRKVQADKKENFGYYADYAIYSKKTTEELIELVKSSKEYVIRFRSSGDYRNKIVVEDLVRGRIEIAQNDQHIVILKRDGLPTYHFAHLVDDHFMRTTHVTRGEEWLPSVPIHIELFETMNWTAPRYAHLPVIMKQVDGVKRKLSKRHDAEAATSYFIERGYPVEGFIEYLYTIANSNYEMWQIDNPDKTYNDFILSFDKMSLDGALFDIEKVEYFSKEFLGNLSTEDMYNLTYEYAKKYDENLLNLIEKDKDYFKKILSIEREKENPRKDYHKLCEIYPLVKFFYNEGYENDLKQVQMPEHLKQADIKEFVEEYLKIIDLTQDEETWFNSLKELALSLNYAKNPKTYKKEPELYKGSVSDAASIVRLITSLRTSSPNLYIVLTILGIDEVKLRLNKYLNLNKY